MPVSFIWKTNKTCRGLLYFKRNACIILPIVFKLTVLRTFHGHGKIICVTLPASHSRYWNTLRHAEQSKQPLDLVTQMYSVGGTWGFMTLSSNSKSGHWSVVVKANGGALSTGLRNAIDTDAVDTDRSQAGTLPPLLAGTSAGSWKKGPRWWRTAHYLLWVSCCCHSAQTQGDNLWFFLSEGTLDPKNVCPWWHEL